MRRTTRSSLLSSVRLAPWAVFGGAVVAQLAPAVAVGQEAQAQVGDVLVTAKRTTEAVSDRQAKEFQDVPQAATVVTQKQIENLNISSIKDAQKLEPSLAIKSYNVRNLTFNIRGFGSDRVDATDALFGGTPIYIDGIYQARPGQAVFDIPDLVGVSVLKGPQGTLGGQDSTGGAIYATTALPSFAAAQSVEVSTGNYGYVKAKASATGAIGGSDQFAYRLSGFTSDREGYVYNTLQSGQKYYDWHDKGIRAQILWQPSADLTVRGVFDYSHVNQACCSELFNGAVPGTGFYAAAARLGWTPPIRSQLQTLTTDILGYKQTAVESEGAAIIVDYTFDGYRLNWTTSYRGWDFHPNNRDGGIISPVIYTNSNGHVSPERTVTSEVKLSTPAGQPVEGTAGLFYLHENLYNHGLTTTSNLAALFYYGDGYSSAVDRGVNNAGQQSYSNPRVDEIAPYARGTWHVTPDLDVTAGLRYSYYDKSALWRRYIYAFDTSGTPEQAAAAYAEAQGFFGADRQFSRRVQQGFLSALGSVQYKINPDVTAYASYARGGRAGGPTLSYSPAAPASVKPEEIDSYEVGLKGSFFNDRLLANFAAFWMNNHNYITRAKDNTNKVLVDVIGNAKLATSKGFELDLRAKPFEGLDAFASFVYDDARYADFKNGVCPVELGFLPSCDLSGKHLALVPKFSFSAGAEYSWKVGKFDAISSSVPLVAYVGSDVSYQSSTASTPDNSAYAVISPYALLNFHLGVKLEDDSYDLQAWVKNALNHRYWQALWAGNWDLGVGEIGGQPGEPLFAGITLRAKFAQAAAPAVLGSAAAALPSRKGPATASRFDWQGVYVGADLGHAWASDRIVPIYIPGLSLPQTFDLSGVIGGLHAGHNWQLSSVVLGVETEFDVTSLSRTVQQDPITTLRSTSTLQGSIRARFGWAFDRLLVFGTGGSQWAGVQNEYYVGTFGDSYSTTHHSWVVGGGLEYALTDNWLARAEYRFSDFGKNLDGNGPIIAPLFYQSHHWKQDRVTAGISWKFSEN